MHKSTNGGTTWTKLLDSLFWDMVQDPVNPNVVYAATGWVLNSNQGDAAVYKSTNFGNTWVKLNTGIPSTGSVQRVKLAIAPNDNNYIYALCVDTQNGLYGFYKSTNAGTNWTYIPPSLNVLDGNQGTGSGGQGNYDLGFIVNATNKNTVYVGGINLWGSTDGAVNFDPIAHWTTSYGPTIHGDIHYIDRQASTRRYFVCSDGGVYRTSNMVIGSFSSNFTTTWANLNNGIQVTSFYRLSSSKNAAGRLCAGAQDNAIFYYKSGAWSTIFGGDGMDNYLDPINNNNVFGASQYGNFWESSNNGISSTYPNTNPNSEAAEWVTPIVADYTNPGVLYIGNENVVKSTDNGQTWNTLTSMPDKFQLYFFDKFYCNSGKYEMFIQDVAMTELIMFNYGKRNLGKHFLLKQAYENKEFDREYLQKILKPFMTRQAINKNIKEIEKLFRLGNSTVSDVIDEIRNKLVA